MKGTRFALVCAGLLAAAALPSYGQQTHYDVKSMDFDLWCTEEAHLSYDRCAKRLPEDLQRFEAYRAIVEKYEIPYLQRRQQEVEFDRDIMHNDPIDNPPDDRSKTSSATDKSPP